MASKLGKCIGQILACLGVVFSLSACGPGYLDAQKHVAATEENKTVFDVLRAYHKAVEDKDLDGLKALISPKYHENGGSTDNVADDYGFDKLSVRLLMLRDNVKKLHLGIKLLEIEVKGVEATIDYEFEGRVLLTEGGIEAYKTYNNRNRMKLASEDGHWLITGGL